MKPGNRSTMMAYCHSYLMLGANSYRIMLHMILADEKVISREEPSLYLQRALLRKTGVFPCFG